jgi:hypothetical protein
MQPEDWATYYESLLALSLSISTSVKRKMERLAKMRKIIEQNQDFDALAL